LTFNFGKDTIKLILKIKIATENLIEQIKNLKLIWKLIHFNVIFFKMKQHRFVKTALSHALFIKKAQNSAVLNCIVCLLLP